MHVPSIEPVIFQKALTLFQKKPQTLMRTDLVLYQHCHEASAHCEDPLLASNAFTLAHHTLHLACIQQKGMCPPQCNEDVIAQVVREMLEYGPQWDDDICKRLRSDHKNFHAVFDGWAKRKSQPILVRHHAVRAFRIFELVLQPL